MNGNEERVAGRVRPGLLHGVSKPMTTIQHYGGKVYLAPRIVGLMPPHTRYVEPFFGGGSVFLRTPPVAEELVGDLNPEVVNFWMAVRDMPRQLHAALWATPYSRAAFREALVRDATLPALESARRFFVRQIQGYSGIAKSVGNWGIGLESRRGKADVVATWQSNIAKLFTTAERLQGVTIVESDALTMLQQLVAPPLTETLIYVDPPYLAATRVDTQVYAHEMTDADHVRLLTWLKQCDARVLVSGYASDLYRDLLHDWHCTTWNMAAYSATPAGARKGKARPRREECVWRNAAAMAAYDEQLVLG